MYTFFARQKTLLASLFLALLTGCGVFFGVGTALALPAPPTGDSAVIQNSTTTTVDIIMTGANLVAFGNSSTTIANPTDLGTITYNGTHPVSAVIASSTDLFLTFPLSVGTDSGSSLDLAIGAIYNSVGMPNDTITIFSGFTDSAAPVFTNVTPSGATVGTRVSYDVSEALGSGTIVFTQTSGTEDLSSPQTCDLTGSALNAGSHMISLSDTNNGCSSGITLVAGAIYTVDFDGQDAVPNAATQVESIDVVAAAAAATIYVDGTFTGPSAAGGHAWAYDAFSTVAEAVADVASGGTVNIGPGRYDANDVWIDHPMSILGPGIDAVATTTLQNTACNYVLTILSGNVTIQGLFIKQLDGPVDYCKNVSAIRSTGNDAGVVISENDIAGGSAGIQLRNGDSSGATISGNIVHDNYRGITVASSKNHTISGNEISSNDDSGIYLWNGGCGSCDGSVSGITASSNNIHGNYYGIYVDSGLGIDSVSIAGNNIHDNVSAPDSYGIYVNDDAVAGSSSTPMTVTGNTISGNSSGIYLGTGAQYITISGNTISDNVTGDTGIDTYTDLDIHINSNVISGNSNGVIFHGGLLALDATANYWGSITGPTHSSNPDGVGDAVSDDVSYRPFYTDVGLTTLSSMGVSSDNLQDLFTNGGSFSLPEGELPTEVSQITVNEDTTINVSTGGGTSSVELPDGTVITKTDGGTIDTSLLQAADVTESSLSGLGTGVVVEGALQWGVPSLGLSFSTPITLHIFVGTSLNGQTLDIKRSSATNSGWTNDGIVAPGTCVVTAGICTFQTTKASYYAVTKTTPVTTSSGGGGGSGMYTSLPTVSIYQVYTNDPNKNANLANIGSIGVEVHQLVKLPDDGNALTQEDTAVYYVCANGKRHAFPNSKAFLTWYKDFSGVKVISADNLASIPLGSNVRYKPGVRMVKFTSSPKVYVVSLGGLLRWVKTEDVAKTLYGADWKTDIDDVADGFYANYAIGSDIATAADFSPTEHETAASQISKDLGL